MDDFTKKSSVLDDAPALVEHLRSRGLDDEASILARALDVASAAIVGAREAHHHALISLSNIVCDKLDELEREETTPNLN
jgi:hypothetical protein